MKRLIGLILLAASPAVAGPYCPSASTACSSEAICNSGSSILMCEDWEDGDHVGWDWNSGWNSCASTSNADGYSGGSAIRFTVAENACECGYPEYTVANQTGTVYQRFYIKYSSGYQYLSWTEQKMSYFRALINNGDAQAWRIMLGIKAKSGDTSQGELVLDALGHSPRWNYNQAGTRYLTGDQWYCVEFSITPNTPGSSDGALSVWLDGVLYMQHSNQNLKNTGDPVNRGPWLSHYYGGDPCGTHPQQQIWYDQLVVSTSRIGCMDAPVSEPPRRVIGVQ